MAVPEYAKVEVRPFAGRIGLSAWVDGKYLGTVHADEGGITIFPYRKCLSHKDEPCQPVISES